MIRTVNLLVLAYYFLGSLMLPLGDFSVINKLPAMYRHCKTFEDNDMSLADFITDHLINIDGLFDKHDQGDQQKPHLPCQNMHNFQMVVYSFPDTSVFLGVVCTFATRFGIIMLLDFFSADYHPEVFRPTVFDCFFIYNRLFQLE